MWLNKRNEQQQTTKRKKKTHSHSNTLRIFRETAQNWVWETVWRRRVRHIGNTEETIINNQKTMQRKREGGTEVNRNRLKYFVIFAAYVGFRYIYLIVFHSFKRFVGYFANFCFLFTKFCIDARPNMCEREGISAALLDWYEYHKSRDFRFCFRCAYWNINLMTVSFKLTNS